MTVLTVYFCGTGSTKFDDTHPDYWQGELVAGLANRTQGREFAEWVVIDGPGSGDLQADDLWTKFTAYGNSGTWWGSGWEENVKHAKLIIKGTFDWQRKKLTEAQYNVLKKANIPIEDVKVSGSWLNRVYDYGDRRVTQQQLQAQIVKLFRKGALPSAVNLVGWSRGGISCHMLANAMFADPELKQIPVRIFAIDPVPGPRNFQDHRVTLKENVKEYVGFYARDERSVGFDCVIPLAPAATTLRVFPMPGRHATLVGNASTDGKSAGTALKEPGLMVRHFAECCLTAWGTRFDKPLSFTAGKLMEYSEAIQRFDAAYVDLRQHVYTFSTHTENERSVSLGAEGKKFSAIVGKSFSPPSGLSSTWHDVLSSLTVHDRNKTYWTGELPAAAQTLNFTGVRLKSGDTVSVTTRHQIVVDPSQHLAATRVSDRLRLEVGTLKETLPAPTIAPALTDDVLNPLLAAFEHGADISIPALDEFTPPYTVTLVWSTSTGGYYEDEQTVDAGKPLSDFLIPRKELEPHGTTPVTIEVYYIVSRDGEPDRASADLVFKIATPDMLAPPLSISQGVMALKGHVNAVYELQNNHWTVLNWPVQKDFTPSRQRRQPQGGVAPFIYQSSNAKIATVDEHGYVQCTGTANGDCTITVTDQRQDTATYRVRVQGCFILVVSPYHYNLYTALNWIATHKLRPVYYPELKMLGYKYGQQGWKLPLKTHTWRGYTARPKVGVFYHLGNSNEWHADWNVGAVSGVMGVRYL